MVAIVLTLWNVMQIMSTSAKTVVACVGDSITFGVGVEDREDNCYPVVLQKILDTKKYKVGNFGVSGATLQKSGNMPYWKEERYEQSLSYNADVVVLLLGTNDVKTENWKDEETFKKDYKDMIAEYQKLKTKPDVILVTPPEIFPYSEQEASDTLAARNTGNGPVDLYLVQEGIIASERQIILEVGDEMGLGVIDLYSHTVDHPEWFNSDGVHPNAKGAKEIAQLVSEKIEQL